MKNIRAIIFDLGGVILNINYQNTIDNFNKLGIQNPKCFYSKKIQTDISHSRLQRFIGTKQYVLVEKYSKKTNDFLTGKIDGGQTTHIKADNVSIGDFIEVEVIEATPFALTAVPL